MRSVATALCILTVAASAAQAAPDWHDGTTDAQRKAALGLFLEGRSLLIDGFFTRAATRFEAALVVWDHPATHMNLAKALMNLDQPDTAVMHLWASMRYAGHPLDLEHVEQAERYSGLILAEELARVVVTSELGQPVFVAGRRVLERRGTWEGLVRAGDVEIASPAGTTLRLKVEAGTSVSIDVRSGKLEPSHQHKLGPSDVASLQRALLGFVVVYPSAAERASWPPPKPTRTPWVDPGDALPAPASALCATATGDIATVCGLYAADHKALIAALRREELARSAALRQLTEMTKGGVIDTLE